MQTFYDNQISIFITKNFVFHERLLLYSIYVNVAVVRLDDILTIYQEKDDILTRHLVEA